ncbi:transcription antitermination factor NusB [Spiroplasma culicicola]|uniref:Transcription antitermination protein NusB n=1 Tax=Spiroplasma culicicola AES-1 TaxID=1276246 RepID=W6A7E5_9MOLU|nr:transcription antitermination factor NusB [Spiroplasma culicicola]AHI52906.1 transcription antitermination protein NusB [Spiroplasma culicicola AES-1]
MEQKSISYLKKQRRNSVQVLYRTCLLEENVIKVKQEMLDNFLIENLDSQVNEYITIILDSFDDLKETIIPLIGRTWSWERLPHVIKAILINGVYEITNNIAPKAVVISESIDMVREFLPSWDTNFINALLDQVNL